MESISLIHLKWAKLIKEHIIQQENNNDDVAAIINRLSKKSRTANSLKFVTKFFFKAYLPDSCFFFIYNISNWEKWAAHQVKLHKFFIGNPSPVCLAHPGLTPSSSPQLSNSPLSSSSPPSSSSPFVLSLLLFNNWIPWLFCNSSAIKSRPTNNPRLSLSSRGLTSATRVKQKSTTTCSSAFSLAVILTYLPLGCLKIHAFQFTPKQ